MNRIKELRNTLGIKQTSLCLKLGVSQATLSAWESGKYEPGIDQLIKMSKTFGVSVDYLLGITGDNFQIANLPKPGRSINVLGRIPAGKPIEAIENIVGSVELDERMSNDGHEYLALLVTGDSMYPDFRDGDTVIVKKQSTADTGKNVVAFINGSDATIKKLMIAENGITLRAINPAFESVYYSNSEVERLPVTILGVVVEMRRRE